METQPRTGLLSVPAIPQSAHTGNGVFNALYAFFEQLFFAGIQIKLYDLFHTPPADHCGYADRNIRVAVFPTEISGNRDDLLGVSEDRFNDRRDRVSGRVYRGAL